MQTFSAEKHGRHLIAVILLGVVSTALVGGLLWTYCGNQRIERAVLVRTSAVGRRIRTYLQRKRRLDVSPSQSERNRVYVAVSPQEIAKPRLFAYRLLHVDLTAPRQPVLKPGKSEPPIPLRRPAPTPVQQITFKHPASDPPPTQRPVELTHRNRPPNPVFDSRRLAQTVVWEKPVNATRFARTGPAHKISEIDAFPTAPVPLTDYLKSAGVDTADRTAMLKASGNAELAAGDHLQLFLEDDLKDARRILVLSRVVRQGRQIWSLVRTDSGRFDPVSRPKLLHALQSVAARASIQPVPLVDRIQEPLSGTIQARLHELLHASDVPPDVRKSLFHLAGLNDLGFDGDDSKRDHIDLLFRRPLDHSAPAQLVYAAIAIDGRTHRFYRFLRSPAGKPDFYNADGESMTKFLMKKPVPAGRRGDGFGWRMHPILHVWKFHEGVDYPAPMGSPILAGGDGTVELISWEKGYGKYVRIRHDEGYETTYAHLSGVPSSLHVGERVTQGQVIAYVGSTGYSTGPHLYYELRDDGHYLDPTKQHLRAGSILSGAILDRFDEARSRVAAILKQFPDRLADDQCRHPFPAKAGMAASGWICLPRGLLHERAPVQTIAANDNAGNSSLMASFANGDATLQRLKQPFRFALRTTPSAN